MRPLLPAAVIALLVLLTLAGMLLLLGLVKLAEWIFT